MLNIDEIKKLAVQHSRGGMLPSVFAAQAILESGVASGGSLLARSYNNYFGIKAGSGYSGMYTLLNTKEEDASGNLVTIKDKFRVYNAPSDSFKDRADLLLSLPRYTEAYHQTTPETQAAALQQAGYATDSSYATKLVGVIDKYNLRTLDNIKPMTKTVAVGGMAIGVLVVFAFAYIYLIHN